MSARRELALLAAVPWRPVGWLASIGVLLLGIASVWVASPVSTFAVTLGVATLAASVAHLLDEAAAEAADATPTTLRARTGTRATAAVAVLAVGVVALAPLALRTGSSASLGVGVQMAGCGLLALTAAATLRHRVPEPGEVVAGCAVALVMVLALGHPLDRWVDLFAPAGGERWAGSLVVWALVGGTSILGLTYATRDPFERRPGLRSARFRAGRSARSSRPRARR